MTAELERQMSSDRLIEAVAEMTPEYEAELRKMLTIAAETEFFSVPFLMHSLFNIGLPARYINPALAIAQDELGHAHVDFRILESLGDDVEALLFDRELSERRYPFFFDMPIENYWEYAVGEGIGEYAGGVLVRNIYEYCSYAPWRRALSKVMLEERFHVKFGQRLMREAVQTEEGRRGIQRAVDWMLPLLVEFVGPPSRANDPQLAYGLKGTDTDGLRQLWLDYAVPFCEELKLKVPAHHDPERDEYVLEYPFPCAFDEAKKEWDFSQPISWQEVVAQRVRRRGPMAERYQQWVRRGSQSLRAWLKGNGR